MKILYLYTELLGYQISVFQELVSNFNSEVHVIHWNGLKNTRFELPDLKGVRFYNREMLTKKSILTLVNDLKPAITYISGWVDKTYLYVAMKLRAKNIPVVCGFDDIWKNSLKQVLGSYVSPIILNKFFSHAWVAGHYQYEYAKKIGFKNDKIIFNLLSADVDIFNEAFQSFRKIKENNYPHCFVYVGRFEHVKGVDLLAEAWDRIKHQKKDWQLVMIGNGSLQDQILKHEDIIVLDFIQPKGLSKEILKFGCFILPSRNEQWSIVMHEFSAAGLPLICSDICGAIPMFLCDGFNGFTFNANSVDSLMEQMLVIINSPDAILSKLGENSHILGQRINPRITASSLISVLKTARKIPF
jgi:glycosyltransferase involved in cell wall biosynthesis